MTVVPASLQTKPVQVHSVPEALPQPPLPDHDAPPLALKSERSAVRSFDGIAASTVAVNVSRKTKIARKRCAARMMGSGSVLFKCLTKSMPGKAGRQRRGAISPP